MFRVLTCLTEQHNWRLVVLAGIVCFIASMAAVNVLQRARASAGRTRTAWLATAGAATGCGIWATHFIGILAYEPGIPIGYDLGLTALSLVAAVVITSAGFSLAIQGRAPWAAPLGGAIVGLGVAVMHYTGMYALELPGRVTWSTGLVIASLVSGVGLATAALSLAGRRSETRAAVGAAALLTLAIVTHHFIGMGAAVIVPDPTVASTAFSMSPAALSIVIASITVGILGICLVGAAVDYNRVRERRQLIAQSEEKLRAQNVILETAVNHMPHGLCMFDRAGRLVISNQRYQQMYGLSDYRVKPGCGFRDIIEMRVTSGTFSGDVDAYCAGILNGIAAGTSSSRISELPDGRKILIAHQPMANGGWVATHLDITEARHAEQALREARAHAERAEQEARAAHARLLDAIEAMPEGVVLFDAEDRFVLWNTRYADLYADVAWTIAVGQRFEDALRAAIAQGRHPAAAGREEEWIAERLALHVAPASSHEQQLADGRWIRIHERRTADGGIIGVRIDITELKQRESSFRLLFDANPVPMAVLDQDTLQFLSVNDAAVAHYGYTRETFLTKTLLDLRPSDETDTAGALGRMKRDISDTNRTWRHVKADGSVIDVAIYRRSLTHQGLHASLIAAIDLTDRKEVESELRRTRSFLDTIVENVPATIAVKDAKNLTYVLMNRAGEEFFGRPREEMIGKTAEEIFPPEVAAAITARDHHLLKVGRQDFYDEQPIHEAAHDVRLVNARRLLVSDADGQPQYLVGVIQDVTERRKAEAQIAHMAHHDPLTDLPNRAAFNDQFRATLDQAAASGEQFALMCIDLDRFKEVNDVFGHAVGDAVLCEVARRLTAAVEGAFLARLGGDEFTVIATQTGTPEVAERLAERLLAAMADELQLEGHAIRMGLSVGVAIYPADGADSTSLLANADAALYRAKADGRGSIRFFEPDMDTRLRERRALQHDLQSAIESGQLLLHYQPQAQINGEVVGFEALVRWRHPTRGLISPGTFIPLAEETGLIMPIGEWILREACREAASWHHPLQIAINLSPIQFRHGDLAGLVHTVLLETGLAASRLELEITEGVLIGDFSRAVAILRRLKALGVRIAMDDFGTGYSSLSYLQSFPFDKIKIDQAFISNVEHNAQSAAIVRAIIALGRGLDLPVVAEGVETKEQLAFLAREACNEIQGYLIGRPRPIGDYAKLIGAAQAKALAG